MRARALRGGDHRDLQIARPHRCRNGSPDGGECRGIDRLRHVQGRRPRDGRDRSAPVAQIGRQVRELGGRTVISVEEALSRLLAPLEKLPIEQISIVDGLGRVLAEDLAARRTQPPFAVSAMDGDAVVTPGDRIGPDQIVSSNSLSLSAFVAACGGIPVSVGNAPDDPAALRQVAAATSGVDLLVTTGGASVGEHDLVRDVLGADGLELDFWQIAMRPGKPLMVGRYRGTPMVGLPGNPVSTLVCALLFLAPALDRLSGTAAVEEAAPTARPGTALPKNERRQDYFRPRVARAPRGTP